MAARSNDLPRASARPAPSVAARLVDPFCLARPQSTSMVLTACLLLGTDELSRSEGELGPCNNALPGEFSQLSHANTQDLRARFRLGGRDRVDLDGFDLPVGFVLGQAHAGASYLSTLLTASAHR